MWDKKESETLLKRFISEGCIVVPEVGRREFFLEKSHESLSVAQTLYDLSKTTDSTLKSYMWIIAISYYSMFFSATALLAHVNKKIDTSIGIHKVTFHALAYYFHILDNKLQKHFLEEYKESHDAVEELLQISEKKAVDLLKTFEFEQEKRKEFTYDMGVYAEESKAITSLKRAKEFQTVVERLLNSKRK